MADNTNENGFPPNDADVRQYRVNNPAILDNEAPTEKNISSISSPAILDSEFESLTSKKQLNSPGLILGDDAGENISLFL
ncbi:MAG: hypothetical protein ACK5KT_11440 [Dysgonomonas sp.]